MSSVSLPWIRLWPSPVSELWPHSDEVLPCVGISDRAAQTEESVMLDRALPHVLARLLVYHSKDKGVLLDMTLKAITIATATNAMATSRLLTSEKVFTTPIYKWSRWKRFTDRDKLNPKCHYHSNCCQGNYIDAVATYRLLCSEKVFTDFQFMILLFKNRCQHYKGRHKLNQGYF